MSLHWECPAGTAPNRQIHQYILQLMLHSKKSYKTFCLHGSYHSSKSPFPLETAASLFKSLITPAAAHFKLPTIFLIMLGDSSQKELYGISVLFVFFQ